MAMTVISTTLCKSQHWFWDCDGLHNGHFEFVIKFEVVTDGNPKTITLMSCHKTSGALPEDSGTNLFGPIKHPWGYRDHPHPTLTGSSQFSKNIFLQAFRQTPSVQTIYTPVNRFNFPTLILSSSILSMAMYLPGTHLWYIFFHSFHYHLVIWGHLLLVLILFLTLIKSLTIWLLSDALLLPLLNFEINCSETILWPIPLIFDLL
jgi:hypothetical protein